MAGEGGSGGGIGGALVPIAGLIARSVQSAQAKKSAKKAAQIYAGFQAAQRQQIETQSAEQTRAAAPVVLPRIPSFGIAEGERYPSSGVGPPQQAVVGPLPGAPPWVQWLLEMLRILWDRQRRTGAANIFIPQWIIDLARAQGIVVPGSQPAASSGVGGGPMASVPSLIPGDYFGAGPGLDFGDIVGANSWACRTLGVGCGSGAAQPNTPYLPGFPQYSPGGDSPFGNVISGGSSMPTAGGGCPTSPFRAGGTASARAVPFVLINPLSGKPVWFGPLGRPLLWSGDMSAMRRVRRVAGRAARFTRSRSTRRRRSGGR